MKRSQIILKQPQNLGDDAAGVKWTDFNGLDGLYANHYEFIRKTVELHDAYLRVNFGNILVSLVSVNLKKKKNNSEGCINCKCRSRDEKSLTVYMKDPNDIKVTDINLRLEITF